jgi:hypothetical protein
VSFSVKSETLFSTASRSVNEDSYKNEKNYHVKILAADGTEAVSEFIFGEVENPTFKLSNGNYTIVAYYGEESVASHDNFYVYGSKNFVVNGDDQSLTVDCKPTCGKMVVDFSTTAMDKVFSDYYVTYETEALLAAGNTVTWTKTTTEPWYMKLNEKGETVKAIVHYTIAETGISDSMELTADMLPDQQWTLHIAPSDGGGSLIITITINDEVNDRVIDVPIDPSWIYGPGNVDNN